MLPNAEKAVFPAKLTGLQGFTSSLQRLEIRWKDKGIKGNILENKDLIESLNQTKASSALIQESLKESYKLQISLDQVNMFFMILYCFLKCSC